MGTFIKLMQVSILFLLSLLAVNSWNIPIPNLVSESTHIINTMAVKMLSECFTDFKEVVIHDDSNLLTLKSIRDMEPLAVIVLHSQSKIYDNAQLRLQKNSFLITSHNVSQLEKMLATFKSSTRWDIMAPFFILDQSNMECLNAREILRTMWSWNIVKSFLLCIDADQIPKVYSYNPYTNRAPQPWEEILDTANQTDGWTMYARPYHIESKCDGFDFDRTEHLDGAAIRVAVHISNYKDFVSGTDYVDDKEIISLMDYETAHIVKAMKESFNATLIFNINQRKSLYYHVIDGSCDVALIYTVPKRRSTYTARYRSYHIVTNDNGFYTLFERIQIYFSGERLIVICTVIVGTLILIGLSRKCSRHQYIGVPFPKLLVNRLQYNRIDRLAVMILTPAIFIYSIVTWASFLGHMTSFLNQQELKSNVETLDHLKDQKYDDILSPWYLKYHFIDPLLLRKITDAEEDCVARIVGRDSAACICEWSVCHLSVLKYNMHISAQPILELATTHCARRDWPLRERFNIFLMNLQDSGHLFTEHEYRSEKKIFEWHKKDMAMQVVHVRPLSISLVQWVFILLLIGLKMTIMSFLFEKCIRSKTTRINENRQAQQRNIARRRRQLLDQFKLDYQMTAGSRPRSI